MLYKLRVVFEIGKNCYKIVYYTSERGLMEEEIKFEIAQNRSKQLYNWFGVVWIGPKKCISDLTSIKLPTYSGQSKLITIAYLYYIPLRDKLYSVINYLLR